MRIIPQAKLDSVSNPRTVASALIVKEQSVDLGRVAESAITERSVEVLNSGKTPIAYHIKSSCRCLTARGGVVKGGQKGAIAFSFTGKGFPGPFAHKLFVYQSGDKQALVAVICIKGYVVADADSSGDYPYHCAGLLLRQPAVSFKSSRTERIACMNGSQRAIRVKKDVLLSSAQVDIKSQPEVLQPGEQGDLVITLTGETNEKLRLYIEADVAPRNREIKIE
jgi:hypothetical protein